MNRQLRALQDPRLLLLAALLLATWILLRGPGEPARLPDLPPSRPDPGRQAESVRLSDVRAGDCLSYPVAGPDRLALTRVSCEGPHRGQVYYRYDLSGDAYPPSHEVALNARVTCLDQFSRVTRVPYELAPVGVDYLYPGPDDWSGGERAVICVAVE